MAHLVGGVGDEALLGLQVFFEAGHHLVEGDDERPHLLGHPPGMGDRSLGRRRRISSGGGWGAMPREADQTRITAIGMIANWGSNTPATTRDSPVGCRLLRVSATRMQPGSSGPAGLEKLVGDRTSSPAIWLVAEHHQVGDGVGASDDGGMSLSPASSPVLAAHLVIHGVVLVGRRIRRAGAGKFTPGRLALDLRPSRAMARTLTARA